MKRAISFGAWLCIASACSAPSPISLDAESYEPVPTPTATAAASAQPGQAPATPRNAFRIPTDKRIAGIAGGGDTVFFSVEAGFRDETGHVGRLARSGDIVSHEGPATRLIRVINQSAVAVGGTGGVAVFKNNAWDFRLAPALEAEALGSATLGDQGELYAAGNKHALYELSADGNTWRIWRYSVPVNGVRAALKVASGVRLVLGSGEVIEFAGGSFKRVTIQGLTVGSLANDTQASWIDEKRKMVWLAGTKSVTVVDLLSNKATTHASPLFFDLKAIAGADTPKGPLVVLSTFGDSALFDGTDFYELDKDGADVLFLDQRHAHAYLMSHRGAKIIDVKHPWLGTGKGNVLPPR